MSQSPIDTFSLACPSGGDMYICQGHATQFIGCCTSDPCTSTASSCPQADVKPATFNKLDYESILPQNCADAEAAWYTCATLSTPFFGCCKSNACANAKGCPAADLVAAELGNATQASVFLSATTSAATVTVTMSSTAASSTGTTLTSSVAAMATAAPVESGSASGLSTGAKAGLGVGAVALAAIIGLVFLLIRRSLKKRGGVVVRGSSPPTTPSTTSFSPARTTYADPNQIVYTPPLFGTPVGRSFPAKAPSSAATYSAGSSPSTGFLSRDSSVRSTTTSNNNGLGIQSYQPYGSGAQQFGYSSPAMSTLAELQGSAAFPSPPVSEMAGPTPVSATRSSIAFRGFRPDR